MRWRSIIKIGGSLRLGSLMHLPWTSRVLRALTEKVEAEAEAAGPPFLVGFVAFDVGLPELDEG